MKISALVMGGLAALALGAAQAAGVPVMDSTDLGSQSYLDPFDPAQDAAPAERAMAEADPQDVDRRQAYIDPFDPSQEVPEATMTADITDDGASELAAQEYPFDPVG